MRKASVALINEALCTQCHSFANGQRIKAAFVSAETALQEMRAQLTALHRRGMPTKSFEGKLFSLRNALHQMTHTLDVTRIQATTDTVLATLAEMKPELHALRQRIHRRWLGGAAVGAFLLVVVMVLAMFLRTIESKDNDGGNP